LSYLFISALLIILGNQHDFIRKETMAQDFLSNLYYFIPLSVTLRNISFEYLKEFTDVGVENQNKHIMLFFTGKSVS